MKRTCTLGPLLLVLVLVGCGGNAVAPDNNNQENDPTPLAWQSIQRAPVSELLRDVDGFGKTQVAVGSGGAIIVRSGNGDWEAVGRTVDDVLLSVEMIDEKNGLIVGNGDILRTADAGGSWQSVATTNSFVDVSASGTSAIAVGINRMLVSNDAGKTWAPPGGTFPVKNFTSVSHHTDQIATAVAGDASLHKTIDGGANWALIAIGQIPAAPRDVAFFSLKLGVIAVDNPPRVFWTDDGSETWKETADFGAGTIVGLEVIDATTGLALLSTGAVHMTQNAGKSWALQTTVPLEFGPATGIGATDDNDWVVVGDFGFVSITSNAGTSWRQESQGRIGTFLGVAFADADMGVAAFDPRLVATEHVLRTSDGGVTWGAVDGQIDSPLHAVLSTTGVGLLIGGLEVAKSTDAGATWSNLSPPTSSNLFAGAVIDDLTYVVCGNGGAVFRTTNGGATWDDVSLDGTSLPSFLDIDFFPGTGSGVMVGTSGSFHSTDGGVTWAEVDVRAVGVACASSDVAVAVDEDILRSTDRGQTWSVVVFSDFDLHAVAFANSKHGVAVGDCGTMFETLDGGATWSEVTRTTSIQLRTVTFRNNESAVAGGRNGGLLLGIQ